MRVGHLQPTRSDWYDRSPLAIQNYFGQSVTNHSATTRWSYTVPSGRKAYFEVGHVSVMRLVAAGVVGLLGSRLQYTPSGGTLGHFLLAQIATNNVGDQSALQAGASFLGFAGDLFEGVTFDQSTGGTVQYRTFAKLTEFDA